MTLEKSREEVNNAILETFFHACFLGACLSRAPHLTFEKPNHLQNIPSCAKMLSSLIDACILHVIQEFFLAFSTYSNEERAEQRTGTVSAAPFFEHFLARYWLQTVLG